jgi:hypothetical protein
MRKLQLQTIMQLLLQPKDVWDAVVKWVNVNWESLLVSLAEIHWEIN